MGTVAFKTGWNHRAVRTRPKLNAQGHDSISTKVNYFLLVFSFLTPSPWMERL